MSAAKEYLGDSVYAEFDGFQLTLTTENGYGPSNTIVLEPEVLRALMIASVLDIEIITREADGGFRIFIPSDVPN